MSIKNLLGTGFFTGLFPFAPGTVGSFAALLVAYLILFMWGLVSLYAFLFFWCCATLLTATYMEKEYGYDPPEMVADEWVGQTIPLLGVAFTFNFLDDIYILILAFIIFRFFDIAKPLGIEQIQRLKGGIGILLDDILAGIYTLIILKLVILLN